MISSSESLKKLELHGLNRLTDRSAGKIISALKGNHSLVNIKLIPDNRISNSNLNTID